MLNHETTHRRSIGCPTRTGQARRPLGHPPPLAPGAGKVQVEDRRIESVRFPDLLLCPYQDTNLSRALQMGFDAGLLRYAAQLYLDYWFFTGHDEAKDARLTDLLTRSAPDPQPHHTRHDRGRNQGTTSRHTISSRGSWGPSARPTCGRRLSKWRR